MDCCYHGRTDSYATLVSGQAAQQNPLTLDGSRSFKSWWLATVEYWRYNLPGFGLVRVRLFPYAKTVFDFLEQYEHVRALKGIDQLGPIRQVLPGAHHTRYEYLMAQLAIITELCHLRGQLPAGLSLGRRRNTFGTIDGLGQDPTNGEILMVFAMLGNIGHLPSTFSGERALMKYLRDHRRSAAAFRSGLPEADRERFDRALRTNNLYQFNYLIASFLLDRYRRRQGGASIADFCQAILRSFTTLQSGETDQSLVALWNLYRSLRRLTYLALDSHYAPVPFSLDLASIFFSLEHYLTDVFVEGSAFQEALERLEGVMRDTVYMAAPQLINHARVGDEILDRLEALDPEPATIGALWDLMGPDRDASTHFTAPSPPDEHGTPTGPIVQLAYDLDPALATSLLPDPLGWERGARQAVGLRSCRFAADFDPRHRHLKVTAALARTSSTSVRQKAALRVGKQLLDFETRIAELDVQLSAASATRNGLALLRFLLPQVLGEQRRFRLRTLPAVETSPVVRVYGSTRAAEVIGTYRDWAKGSGLLGADQLNEVVQLEAALRAIDYRGAIVAFAGSTEVIQSGQIVAEFDGLAILLSRDVSQPVLMIVEAKNTQSGNTEAEAQIRSQFRRLTIPDQDFEVSHLGTKGAYATVTLPRQGT